MSGELGRALREAIVQAGWRDRPAGDPPSPDAYLALLRPLYAAGRGDLPLGRLLEGHVDAVQIVQRLGTDAQVAQLRERVAAGAMLGVWNAALPGEPLVLTGRELHGGKGFASGAGLLDLALVTADTPAGPQLILLDLARTAPMIDRNWWRVTGMQRSETHQVRWRGAAIEPADLLGDAGSYAAEPWFSGGALRFVAVHAGGIAGLFDRTRDHLVATGRAADPFQAARLADLFALAESAAAIVERAARRWFCDGEDARLARVASARMAVLDAAVAAMALAREAVGVQSALVDHPLSRLLGDLDVYLRQPMPDAMRQRAGAAAAAGSLVPLL